MHAHSKVGPVQAGPKTIGVGHWRGGLVLQVVARAVIGMTGDGAVLVDGVGGGTAELVLQHGLACLEFAGTAAGLGRIGDELCPRQAQRVQGQRHVKLVEHQVDMHLLSQVKAQFPVELLAFGGAVGAVAVNAHGAVVGHDADRAERVAHLVVGAVQAAGAHKILVAQLGLRGRSLAKGLDDAAGRIAIKLGHGAAQHFDVVGGGQTDGGALALAVRRGGGDAVNQQADTANAEGRAGAKAANRKLQILGIVLPVQNGQARHAVE